MKTYLHVFLMLFPYSVFGNIENNDYGSIRGFVFTSDGQPAAYVSVIIYNTSKGTRTDDNGAFELKRIKPGEYTIVFTLLDYAKRDTTVRVKEGEIAYLNIRLNRTIAELQQVLIEAKIPKYVETKTSTSLRLNLPLIEVPQNIAVIPNRLLGDQGLVSMTQAIRNVSGIQKVQGELNDYRLIIRGLDATYNVMRNGVGGMWFNQQEDIAMLEKIEVVKGPAGFLSTLAEPGGIVNNVTKQPTKSRLTRIEGGFGSFDLLRLTVDFGGALYKSRKLYYRLNAGMHHQGRAFQFGKAYRYFVCPALTYEINRKTSMTAEFNYMYGKTSGNNDGIPAVDGKMFVLPRDFAVADPATDAITVIDNYYRLHFKHDLNENWHLNVQLASVHGPWNGNTLRSSDGIPISNDTLYRVYSYNYYINYSHPSQVFIDGTFQTGSKVEHKVLFGVDYHNEGSKGSFGGTWGQKKFGLYIPRPDYYVSSDSLKTDTFPGGHFKNQWISFYIQDQVKIAQKLIVALASHLTHASYSLSGVDWGHPQKRDLAFSPRVGITWLFGDSASIYALYDRCFLPQAGADFEKKPFKPLTGSNIETGFKSYFFNKKLSLNLSLFHIVKNNLLIPDPVHDWFLIQRGQVVSKGIDFDILGNITPALTINANYEYVSAKITKDNDPNMVGAKNFGTPDHQANFWLQYRLLRGALNGLSFSIGDQYMGRRCADLFVRIPGKTNYLPSYNLLNAGLGYSHDWFNVSLHVYNIANTQYATTGYFDSPADWRYTPGEPINFRLSFGVNLYHNDK